MCSREGCNNNFIENKKHNLCPDCNYERIHGKTRISTLIERESSKPYKVTKPKRNPVRTKINKLKIEKSELRRSSDREWYLYQFKSKPNECEECGTWLPDEFEDENGNIYCISQYSHIITKGSNGKLRHHKLNCNRLCPDHHDQWEFGKRENMKIFESNQKLIEIMYKDINNK